MKISYLLLGICILAFKTSVAEEAKTDHLGICPIFDPEDYSTQLSTAFTNIDTDRLWMIEESSCRPERAIVVRKVLGSNGNPNDTAWFIDVRISKTRVIKLLAEGLSERELLNDPHPKLEVRSKQISLADYNQLSFAMISSLPDARIGGSVPHTTDDLRLVFSIGGYLTYAFYSNHGIPGLVCEAWESAARYVLTDDPSEAEQYLTRMRTSCKRLIDQNEATNKALSP